jgi:pyruvate,orthophosphate dikinase
VLFSRNPNTGKKLFGEFIPGARGEDLVGGMKNTIPLSNLLDWDPKATAVVRQLKEYSCLLERHIGDMVEIEFTIEEGILWLLQVRKGKRSNKAHFQILHDMFFEGLIGLNFLETLKQRDIFKDDLYSITVETSQNPIAKGIGASKGVVKGEIFTKKKVNKLKDGKYILLTTNTSPDDFPLLLEADGIITRNGGATCHAAVVARELKKPCIVGIGESIINPFTLCTMDGESGEVYEGEHNFTKTFDSSHAKILNNLKIILSGDNGNG